MSKPAITSTPFDSQWDWNLLKLIIRRCREKGAKKKIADSMGGSLNGHDLLLKALVLRKIFRRNVLSADEKCVGLLIPPNVASTVANVALSLDKRIAINLNYSVSESIINDCIEQAGIRKVITSSKVLEKFGIKPKAELVFIEDLRKYAKMTDKVTAVMMARVLPEFMVHKLLGLDACKPEDLLTIIFTSGSTGNPKGVPLTLNNVASNVQGFNHFIRVLDSDNFLGVLPFFHSFGFTVTLWGALTLPSSACYHFNPLDSRQVGKLVEANQSTVVLGTPTFIRMYSRKIEPEQFKSVQVVVVGAEKMPVDLFGIFEERFGVRPVEGYGATETSPVACVNLPPSRATSPDPKAGIREGSVGKPIPGVSVRIVSLDDGHVLNTNESGMIQISGPNIMGGYLNRPDLTEKVLKDGWYTTGDVGHIDDDGFVFVTGRQSRFSKIGGEMVPHIQVEEAIMEIVGDQEGALCVAVSAVPDEKKGERLIVLHTNIPKTPGEITKALREKGLPNLFIPSEDSFFRVDAIPILGTGKLDLRGLQEMAKQKSV